MKTYITEKDKKRIEAWTEALVQEKIKKISKKEAIARIGLSYPVKGYGKHRIVFDLGKGKILKLPRVRKGIRCNRNEVSLFQNSSSRMRKYLCKVVDSGHGWVVMKKMKTEVPRKKKYARQLKKVYEKFLDKGVRISDLLTRRSKNPKWINLRLDKKKDRVVLIDYANQYRRT